MALKLCRECRKEVSTQAKTCPQCGVPHPTSQLDPCTKHALGCLALIIVVAVIGQIGSESSAPPATNNAQTATQMHIALMEITGLAAWIETSSDASSTTRPRMIKRLLARRLRGRSTMAPVLSFRTVKPST